MLLFNFEILASTSLPSLPISLCNWSQTVQKHTEIVSFCKCLCIPRVPLIHDILFPFSFSEAVILWSSVYNAFSQILQNSQESACAGVSFWLSCRDSTFDTIKKGCVTDVSL